MFLGEKIIDERHIQIIWEDSEEQQSRECMNKIWLNMKQHEKRDQIMKLWKTVTLFLENYV